MLPSGSNLHYQSHRFEIADPSQIGEVRRFAIQLCQEIGCDEVAIGRATIIINELATNLLKHVGSGEILLQVDHSLSSKALEIISLDRGSGLSDVNLCFSDGYSTSATAGTGLGAVRRQADQCDLYTSDKGTAIFASVRNSREMLAKPRFYFGGICLPIKGEQVSGDGWVYRDLGDQKIILVADGLGHGLLAHQASLSAIETLKERREVPDVLQLMQEIHFRLKSTRGAAVSVSRLNLETEEMNYLSIGNVRTVIVSAEETKSLIFQAGTLGLQFRTFKPLTASIPKDSKIIIHSDGLTQRWDLKQYPGLAYRHPGLICAILYRDFSRGTDDITVLAGGWLL